MSTTTTPAKISEDKKKPARRVSATAAAADAAFTDTDTTVDAVINADGSGDSLATQGHDSSSDPGTISSEASEPTETQSESTTESNTVYELPPDAKPEINAVAETMQRPHLDEMVKSIKENGQIQPGVMFEHADGTLEIIAGITRWLACVILGIAWQYVKITRLGKFDTVDEWVAAEYETSKHRRSLNRHQAALDAAHLCKKVYVPAAERRQKLGKPVSHEERGRAHEHAAEVAGVRPNAVKTLLPVIGTPFEKFVAAEELSPSKAEAYAKKYRKLTAGEQAAVCIAAKANDIEKITELMVGKRTAKREAETSIPESLVPIFSHQKQFAKKAKALVDIAEWMATFPTEEGGFPLPDTIKTKPLRDLAETLKQERPHCVCPYCGGAGDCGTCGDKGWLTERDSAVAKERAKEAMRKRSA